MAYTPTPLQRPGKRRALQSLDANSSLNAPRGLKRKAPITFDTENEDAVLDGVALGIYSYDAVLVLTNRREPTRTATPNPQLDSDDEEIGNMSRPGGGGPHEALNERPIDFQGDGDGDEDDEMLMEDMDEELGENAEEADVEGDEDSEDADDEGGDEWFDPSSMGLKEINNLAHFGVSSHKPGNGVEELLSEDLNQYWQSVLP